MHRRLHIGPHKLRMLPTITSDAPSSLSTSRPTSCHHCIEANATHIPHRGSGYTPSHPGRLVHADIAGPFKRSKIGGYQYMLVIVDDHTRFKSAYFMQSKSEAPRKVQQFVASFNAFASQGKSQPVRIVALRGFTRFKSGGLFGN